jgi:hypothetical protein
MEQWLREIGSSSTNCGLWVGNQNKLNGLYLDEPMGELALITIKSRAIQVDLIIQNKIV